MYFVSGPPRIIACGYFVSCIALPSCKNSGLDITPKSLFGFLPDSQRYFDYHHTSIDHIEAVNKRELEMGAASMTALVWLLDKYGLK